MPENEVQAVSLKLPTFWPEQPQVWFVQAEAQFNLRNITADDTKYHYLVAALDQATAKRVIDLLSSPPANDKYQALKDRLNDTYGLSEFERGTRLLHVPALGDDKPSVLMDNMLALMEGHEPCFIFRCLFLERLPEEIRGILAHSQITDCRQLAKAADTLWETRQPTANAVHEGTAPSTSAHARPRKKPALSTPQRADSGLCFYHAKFGDQARSCQPPCSHSSSGNEQAGRH